MAYGPSILSKLCKRHWSEWIRRKYPNLFRNTMYWTTNEHVTDLSSVYLTVHRITEQYVQIWTFLVHRHYPRRLQEPNHQSWCLRFVYYRTDEIVFLIKKHNVPRSKENFNLCHVIPDSVLSLDDKPLVRGAFLPKHSANRPNVVPLTWEQSLPMGGSNWFFLYHPISIWNVC